MSELFSWPTVTVGMRHPSVNGDPPAPGRGPGAGRFRLQVGTETTVALQAARRTRIDPGPGPAQVPAPLGPHVQPRRGVIGPHCPFPLALRRDPWRACLISDRSAVAPLSSHATARPDRLAHRYKARPHRPAGGSGASPSDPSTLRPPRRASLTSIRWFAFPLSVAPPSRPPAP